MGSLTQVPYCVTHLYDHKLLVHSENDNLSVHKVFFIDTWRLNADLCTVNAPDHTREVVLGKEGLFDHSFPVFIGPKNEHYVDGVEEPVIRQLCIVRPWILVARTYRRLPLGNFKMQKNVRLQEFEQVVKVRDYERCFSLDHRTTIQQGNLWILYQNGISTWRRSWLRSHPHVHEKA